MRRSPLFLIALAAALALPGAAAAKEISKVVVCGASGCANVPRGDDGFAAFMDGGLPADPPARAAGWYSIRYTVSAGEGEDMESFEFRNAYVPAANRLRSTDEHDKFAWYEAGPELAAALRPTLRHVGRTRPRGCAASTRAGPRPAGRARERAADPAPRRRPRTAPATGDGAARLGLDRARGGGRRDGARAPRPACAAPAPSGRVISRGRERHDALLEAAPARVAPVRGIGRNRDVARRAVERDRRDCSVAVSSRTER